MPDHGRYGRQDAARPRVGGVRCPPCEESPMWKRVSRIVPMVQLSDVTFATRHRVLRIILALHLPVLSTVAFVLGRSASAPAGHASHAAGESATIWIMISAVAVC